MVDVKENLGGKIDDAADKASRWTQETWDKSRAAAKGSEGSQAGGVVEAVKDKVQAAAAGASDLASAAKDTAGEWASAVGDAVVHVKDKVRDVASAAGEKASEMGQDLTALIRRYPVQSLLASLGAGFLVACALRRS